MQQLAAELRTPEGKARYAENRANHISGLASYKRDVPGRQGWTICLGILAPLTWLM